MDLLDRFDLDLSLDEAALAPDQSPARRMLANACIGMDTLDAFYAVAELRQAAAWVHDGDPAGRRKLVAILGNDAVDDFQRCLYYALAGRGIVAMLDDLAWLEALLERRAKVAGRLHARGVRVRPLVSPYVAAEADGPVGVFDPDFAQGPSWWLERDPLG
ncbi:hypothetical protein D9601_17015 [Sphingomonas sp. MA1305]|jgi:hypothetical protein|uniref:hypothetical protein n=1 Tax=Sphingomonas sp. MA1305 TaxID=2479204 RepID=UPI0018DF0C58|nr:hypothetical protein [Sphingomonas sp. MA1305]MBI0477051.1 hypothetical protein [Sphingomonas sp. MA1305]